MSRSFTYIDDVTNILMRLIKKPATQDSSFDTKKPNSSSSWCPNRILNIGNDNAVGLLTFINMLEKELGLEGIKDFESLQLALVQFRNEIGGVDDHGSARLKSLQPLLRFLLLQHSCL